MRKIFKIILVIFAAIIIVVVAFGAVILLDVAAYTATGAQTLTPTGTSVGKAIVIYDPGLSGNTKTVADKVASDLQTKGYTVTLAGIKSSAAGSISGFNAIVVGGPVYAGALTSSVKDTLKNIDSSRGQGTKIGIYGSGQGATTPEDVAQLKQSIPSSSDNSLSEALVVKIGEKEDLTTRAQDFVNQLLS
jgi:flavorubredoxin